MRHTKAHLSRHAQTLLLGALTASLLVIFTPQTHAVSFGIYDPRALAMSGTTVALANPQHAQFYNPALLAFHNQREEESRSGRLYLPILTAQASDALVEVARLEPNTLEQRISDAIAAYNQTPSTTTALRVRDEAGDLRSVIDAVDNENLPIEAFAGLAIVEPGFRGGGAFHIGVRLIGGGTTDISASDRELLDKYIETLDAYIAGEVNPPHPELYNDDGELQNFTADFDSTLSGRGALIVEWGVTAAKEFELFGQPVAFGITPKLMEVRAYQETGRVVQGDFGNLDDEDSHLSGNVDIGLAMEFHSGMRVGVAVKDVVAQNYAQGEEDEVRIRPRARAGLAFVRPGYALGVDLDLLENDPIGFEQPSQELAFGAELSPAPFAHLRIGYKYDLAASHEDAASVGMGLEFNRLLVDIAYSHGENTRGFSTQLGLAF